MAAAKDKACSEPIDLVLALGHEIGNLLAATRLHAHLIDADTTATELSAVSATIGELSSRMGSLLAQIRPLVSPVPEGAPNIDPIEVLDGVHRGIEESCDERVAVDFESATNLPMAVIDPEPLHHILLTSIYQALEETGPAGKVAVSAFARADSIVFTVDDESKFEDVAGAAVKGRALLNAVADAILRPRGGQITIRSLGAGNRVELTVPVARR
jgi:C4-dicarboxylate-specific signal transduction histidine kinase